MFILSLALGKSIRELMESMTTKEFYSWFTYYQERPFGDLRSDYRMARNTQVLISPYLKEDKPLKDFVLSFGDSLPSDEQLYEKLTGILGNGK